MFDFIFFFLFFFSKTTKVMLEEEEIPKTASVDYLLEPGSQEGSNKQHPSFLSFFPVFFFHSFVGESEDNGLVIFLVDVSGSMCVTSEVEELQSAWAELRSNFEGGKMGRRKKYMVVVHLIFKERKGNPTKDLN